MRRSFIERCRQTPAGGFSDAKSLSFIFPTQNRIDILHLFFGGSQCPGVVDNKVSSFNLLLVRNLGGHAACHFGACSGVGEIVPSREALNPLFRLAGNDNQIVKSILGVRLKDKGRFNDSDGLRIAGSDLIHPFIFISDDGGMNNSIQFFNPRS